MYMLPFSKSTEVLYYNKTFFEENNLTVPTTWDEMEAVMHEIQAIDPYSVPLGYDSEANWFITMCEQLGTPYTSTVSGQKFLFDVEENRNFVEQFSKWYQYGLVTTSGIEGAYTSDLFVQTDPYSRKSYMVIGSSAGARYHCPEATVDRYGNVVYPFEVGVAQIPQVDVDNPKAISQGPSLCMFKKADSQEMAATWLFMEFLTTTIELQAEISATTGYASVIKDLDEKCEPYAHMLAMADGNQNLQMSTIKQCIAQESAMFYSPAFIGSAAAREAVTSMMQTCMWNAGRMESAAEYIKNQFAMTVTTLRLEYDIEAIQ
jgi:multiple sugar transport system substrate-binding protein